MENGIFYRQMFTEKVSWKQRVKDDIKEELQAKYLQKIEHTFELKFRVYKTWFDSMVETFKQSEENDDDFYYERPIFDEEIAFVERVAHDVQQFIAQRHLCMIGIKVSRAENKITLFVKDPLPVFHNDFFV